MTRHKTQQQVIFDLGMRRLQDPKLKQEKTHMDQQQVIFEYGKLQLNFVSVSQQLMQVSTALAAANKELAELKKTLKEYQSAPEQVGEALKPEIVRTESAGA